jgi:hypothetical protein
MDKDDARFAAIDHLITAYQEMVYAEQKCVHFSVGVQQKIGLVTDQIQELLSAIRR